MSRRPAWALLALGALLACSEPDVIGPRARPDSGLQDDAFGGGHGGDPAPFSKQFVPPADPGPAGVLFTASGEALAQAGYPFPPPEPNSPAFVDGWEVSFDQVLITLGRVTLSDRPDVSAGDQAQTGAVVAEVAAPWAIDLHKDDPSYLDGKGGGGERAVPFAALTTQNKNGSAPFATDGTRYALGFDLEAATLAAYNVNLGPQAIARYQSMVARGCSVFYSGTASFKGSSCHETEPPFDALPRAVRFELCFVSPTSYVNAQNPDNDPAAAFPNEEHQRGIAFKSNTRVVAQATLHTDHPFWESVAHDAPLHFDMLAARAESVDGGVPTVTLDAMRGVDFQQFRDRAGRALPFRSCTPSTYVAPTSGAMHFDPGSVPQQPPSGDPALGLRDALDFMTYNQSTQGHLNADGLAFVSRNYASPR